MTYYSALHYAAKAEKSAMAAAESAAKASQASGEIIQLGFDGSMEDGKLVFKHAPSGVEIPYDLLNNYEYEVDMAFPSLGSLSDDLQVVVRNGSDIINFVSSLHRSGTESMKIVDMKQVMRFNASTGYRWLFKASYKITPAGDKVFLLYPVVTNTSTLDETITGQKTIETTNEKTLNLVAKDIDTSYIPLTDSTQAIVSIRDVLGNIMGYIFAHNFATGHQQVGFQAHRVVDGVDKYVSFLCGVDGNGTPYTKAYTPTNDTNSDQVATTRWVKDILAQNLSDCITYSRAGDGYVRFPNGIQICWGTGKAGSTHTFAKAFSTIWSATVSMVADEDAGYVAYVGTLSTTQIKIRRHGGSDASCRYIAIGRS